jgi:hypothetical protein
MEDGRELTAYESIQLLLIYILALAIVAGLVVLPFLF